MTWKLHSRHLRASICAGCFALAGAAIAQQPEAQQILNLGLRGVYIVPNQRQWGDEQVHFGLKSRGLDVAFRESSLTMHLTREIESTSRADASTSRACEGLLPKSCSGIMVAIRQGGADAGTYEAAG